MLSYLCIVVIIEGQNFCSAVKVAISAMQSLTYSRIKLLPMRTGGEIGKNFWLYSIVMVNVYITCL